MTEAVFSEIQAGLARPASIAEMNELIERHLPRIHEAHRRAEELRPLASSASEAVLSLEARIATGARMITEAALHGASSAAVDDAQRRLAELRREHEEKAALLAELETELRGESYWLTAGLGLILAWGLSDVLRSTGLEEGWKPPEGSIVRIVLPGLVNVATKIG